MSHTEPREQPASVGRRVSLVLGSGGARGYAHIGAIEELRAQGFEIASIAGSSMGALIGGIHAAGKLDEYRDWVLPLQRSDVFRLLDLTLSGGGLIKGDRIIGALRELVGDINIEDLPIAYTAVAVDIDAQRELWFSDGPMFDAIRASIAIPTVFRPHEYQGRLLVDGGLLNPLPVSPTLRDRTDFTIAVNINGEAEASLEPPRPPPGRLDSGNLLNRLLPDPKEGGNAQASRYAQRLAQFIGKLHPAAEAQQGHATELGKVELFARSLDTVQETITRLKLAAQPPDLLINVPRNACAFYEFHRARELIELGRERTRRVLADWQPPSHRVADRQA